MIELRLSMPAPVGYVTGFVRLVEALDPDAEFHATLSTLVAKAAIPEVLPRLVTGTVTADDTEAPVDDPEPEPEPVEKSAPPARRKRTGGRAASGAPGTIGGDILECLDRHDGRFEGSTADLAREACTTSTPLVVAQQIRRYAAEGLVRQEHGDGDRKVTAIELTRRGWEVLGDRAASRCRPGFTRPEPEPDDSPPLVALTGLGPIERRPFDPQRVRDAQAAMS